ncbi:MAG TPA: hypothetical protein VK399_09010 [Longimicrobiaceae bacterium]|nr:hypothetical protein [Longimicrobiaceae bacterium]
MQTLSKSTVSSQDTLLVLPEGAARHELNDGNRERWLRLIGRGLWYVSHAHTDGDVERAVAPAREVLARI